MSEEMSVEEFRRRQVNSGSKIGLSDIPKKKSKYSSVKTVVDGITFMSKKESEFYKKLKLLKDKGEIIELELQPRYPYEIHYQQPRENYPISIGDSFVKKGAYVSDFRVTYADGRVEVFDVKGFSTKKFLLDKKIVEKLYGVKVITI